MRFLPNQKTNQKPELNLIEQDIVVQGDGDGGNCGLVDALKKVSSLLRRGCGELARPQKNDVQSFLSSSSESDRPMVCRFRSSWQTPGFIIIIQFIEASRELSTRLLLSCAIWPRQCPQG